MEVGFMLCRSTKTSVAKLAVGSMVAIVVCFVLAATATAAFVFDEKMLNRANKALRNGDYQLAEKIYRDLVVKDAHDNEARLGLSQAQLKQRNLQAAYDNAARVILLD